MSLESIQHVPSGEKSKNADNSMQEKTEGIRMKMQVVSGPTREEIRSKMRSVPSQKDSVAGPIGYNYNIPNVRKAGEQKETKIELTPQENNFIRKAEEIFAQRFMALKGDVTGSNTAFSKTMNSPEGKKAVEASLNVFKDKIKGEKIVAKEIVDLRSGLAISLMEIYKAQYKAQVKAQVKAQQEKSTRTSSDEEEKKPKIKPKPKAKTGLGSGNVLSRIAGRMWQ